MNDIADAFYKLKIYCETEHFKGWDPYDGLNSKIFQAIPLLKKVCIVQIDGHTRFQALPFQYETDGFRSERV